MNPLAGLILSMSSNDGALTDLEDRGRFHENSEDTGAQGNKTVGAQRSRKVRDASSRFCLQ